MADPQQGSYSSPAQTNKKWALFHRQKLSNCGNKVSICPTLEKNEDPVYVSEIRVLKTGLNSTKKRRTIVLKPLRIELIKANGEEKREVLLSDITTIKYDDKTNALIFKGKGYLEKALCIQAGIVEGSGQGIPTTSSSSTSSSAVSSSENESHIRDESMKLLLMMNSVRTKYFGYLSPCLSTCLKEQSLSKVFCERYTGGIAKRDGEEWFFDAKQKRVTSDLGVEPQLSFDWDGCHFKPRDAASAAIGSGMWDGFRLSFVCPSEGGHSHSHSVSVVRSSKVREAPEPGRSRSKTTAMPRSGSVNGEVSCLNDLADGLAKDNGFLGLDEEETTISKKVRRPTHAGTTTPSSSSPSASLSLTSSPSSSPSPRRKKKRAKERVESDQIGVSPLRHQHHHSLSPFPPPKSFLFLYSDQAHQYVMEEEGGGGGGGGVVAGKHNWQWTRHFLKRVNGEGEWIVEGSMPEPVVMFLQILRLVRGVDSYY